MVVPKLKIATQNPHQPKKRGIFKIVIEIGYANYFPQNSANFRNTSSTDTHLVKIKVKVKNHTKKRT